MAELEQTAGSALKLDPAGHLRWWLPGLSADLRFARWLDARMPTFPGEPDRRCDTVAELRSEAGAQAPWAVILEIEARGRARFGDRLLEYVARARRRLRHGRKRRDRYEVAALVVVLTGRLAKIQADMRLPETGLGLQWSAGVVNMSELSATETLERIAKGELTRAALVWVPLMQGGGEQATVDRWAELARQEADPDSRQELGMLARVFAERMGLMPLWGKVLEGWEMWKSQTIATYRNQGRQQGVAEGRARALVESLQARFPGRVPPDLEARVLKTQDEALLQSWLRAAVTGSLEDLQALVAQSPPPPAPATNGPSPTAWARLPAAAGAA